MLTLRAPAKINLTLEVLGKRPDGFHEVRSVMQAINLCDTLRFNLSQDLAFKSDMPGWSAKESLVAKVVSLLQQTAGSAKGARIEVGKRIPLMSGLGGDSSDAAASLRGLNELWKLGLSSEEVLGLARQLGSDVAFFLYGGTALAEGRGEVVTSLPAVPHMWVVLAVPPVPRLPGKTGRLYASLKPAHYTDGHLTGKMVEALRAGGEFEPSLLFNTFANVAFARNSELSVYREHILKLGAPHVHLAGSGPTLFTLLNDRAQAEGLSLRLQQQRLECYLAETLGGID